MRDFHSEILYGVKRSAASKGIEGIVIVEIMVIKDKYGEQCLFMSGVQL